MIKENELPEGWTYAPVSKVTIVNPKKYEIRDLPDNEQITFLGMADVTESGKIRSQQVKSLGEVKKGFTYFRKNDVLFAKITPCMENGKGAIARIKTSIGFGSTEFHILRPNENILPEWIYFYLSLKSIRKNAEQNMSGSAGQKRVPTSFFDKIKILVPPLPIQKKIVAVLEKAEKLTEWRKEADALTDEFLKSVFLEMFWDPVKNPNEWSKEVLNTNVEKICVSYVGPCNKYYTSKENGVPMIRTGNIKENYLNLDKLKYVTKVFHEKQKKSQLKEGDLLIARHGTNGQASLVTKELGVANSLNVVIVRPNKEKYNSIFFTHCFNTNSNLSSLGNKLGGSTQNVINTRAIQSHELIRPPIELQQKFASIVEKVEDMRYAQKQSKAQIDDLFNALMQKAFKGELT